MTALRLKNIRKSYEEDQPAFSCDLLTIAKGDKVGLAGATGSGKSTLLKVIGGLEKPDRGDVLLNDLEVYPKLDRLIAGHPDIAYLSQSFELPKFIRVEEYLFVHPYEDEEVEKLAQLCDVSHLLASDTRALSGGERQRVALTKILLKEPKVLLLDEPFSSLDSPHKRAMKSVINGLTGKLDITILMVSHDPSDLLPWADQVLVLKEGEIVQQDSPKKTYYKPANEYVASLFGLYQMIDLSNWHSVGRQQSIVRPEVFKISHSDESESTGKVEEVLFHGDHDLVHFVSDGQKLFTRTPVGLFKVGDEINVIVDMEQMQE